MKNIKNIDELFREGLKDHSLTPHQDLKAQFLQRAEQKKKRKIVPFWYFAAAASLIAVLGFFTLNLSNSTTKGVAVNNTTANIEVEPLVKSTEIENKETLAEPVIAQVSVPAKSVTKKAIAKAEPKFTLVNTQKVGITKNADVPATIQQDEVVVDELIPDELTLAYLESEEVESFENISSDEGDLFQEENQGTVVIIANNTEPEPSLYIPEINQDSQVTLAEANTFAEEKLQRDNSLIAKVFTELKHLKHGEKVNVTFANNELREDSFLGNEAIEIKERWNWIKNTVSKK